MARVSCFLIILFALSGCLKTEPGKLPLLSDADVAAEAPNVDMVAPAESDPPTVAKKDAASPGGFLARLFHKPAPPVAAAPPLPVKDQADVKAGPTPKAKPPAPVPADTPESQVAPQHGGFLSRLFGRPAAARSDAAPTGADVPDQPDRKKRHGLFGPRRPGAASAPQVSPGTVLPYGVIGVACGVKGKALGHQVDRYPARGRGYRLFDTAPGNIHPHTHFLTGFVDGCPRQFTAALALLGSPSEHETVRYDIPGKSLAFSSADKAYEKLKRRICHVGRGKPCGQRSAAMDKVAAFLTFYETFGGNERWAEALLYKGEILASDVQKR